MAHLLLAGLASHGTPLAQLAEALQALGPLVQILPIIPFFLGAGLCVRCVEGVR
jgi:hypothetical protein